MKGLLILIHAKQANSRVNILFPIQNILTKISLINKTNNISIIKLTY